MMNEDDEAGQRKKKMKHLFRGGRNGSQNGDGGWSFVDTKVNDDDDVDDDDDDDDDDDADNDVDDYDDGALSNNIHILITISITTAGL